MEKGLFQVEIINELKRDYENEYRSETLSLPTTREQVEQAFERIGINKEYPYYSVKCETEIPPITNYLNKIDFHDINRLNYVAEKMNELPGLEEKISFSSMVDHLKLLEKQEVIPPDSQYYEILRFNQYAKVDDGATMDRLYEWGEYHYQMDHGALPEDMGYFKWLNSEQRWGGLQEDLSNKSETNIEQDEFELQNIQKVIEELNQKGSLYYGKDYCFKIEERVTPGLYNIWAYLDGEDYGGYGGVTVQTIKGILEAQKQYFDEKLSNESEVTMDNSISDNYQDIMKEMMDSSLDIEPVQ